MAGSYKISLNIGNVITFKFVELSKTSALITINLLPNTWQFIVNSDFYWVACIVDLHRPSANSSFSQRLVPCIVMLSYLQTVLP